jgi:hypothetical protein
MCHACVKVAKINKNYVKKDLNQFPKILQDVKVDGETVLRAIHLSVLQTLPQHSSLEIYDEEKVCRRRSKTNTKLYFSLLNYGRFHVTGPYNHSHGDLHLTDYGVMLKGYGVTY